MRNVVVVGAMFLASCGGEASRAQQAVREILIDPESARFGDFGTSESGGWACLTVNSKNRMGGYTGDSQIFLMKSENGEWLPFDSKEVSHDECLRELPTISPAEAARRAASLSSD